MKLDDMKLAFRTKNSMTKIFDLAKKNPNKDYCLVRYDDAYDPNGTNVDNYLNDGWDFVVDDSPVIDYRSNAPDNAKEKNLRKSPLTKKGKGNAEFVVMSIDKEKNLQNEKARAARTLERYIASSTGRKVVKKGTELHIQDPETNTSNVNQSNEV